MKRAPRTGRPSISFRPDTLARQVTGLTNGTEYEFEVRAVYSPSGEGPWSNTATGTPLGPIGAPVVTATPGNTQVDLSWTKPSDGGRVIDSYIILWRPVGTTGLTGATATSGTDTNPPATQTTITGLTNGTEYEFFVTAKPHGVVGPQGTATATPFAPGLYSHREEDLAGQGIPASALPRILITAATSLLRLVAIRKYFTGVAPGTYSVTEMTRRGWAMSLPISPALTRTPMALLLLGT